IAIYIENVNHIIAAFNEKMQICWWTSGAARPSMSKRFLKTAKAAGHSDGLLTHYYTLKMTA
ncbi:MAG TPA: hypothetical protein VN626_04085, partial [Clostridia bacterium]|nr:hypothetical protein [Clostridia bacterium]